MDVLLESQSVQQVSGVWIKVNLVTLSVGPFVSCLRHSYTGCSFAQIVLCLMRVCLYVCVCVYACVGG